MSRTAVNRFILPPGINIIQIPNSNAWIISNITTQRKQLINLPKNTYLKLEDTRMESGQIINESPDPESVDKNYEHVSSESLKKKRHSSKNDENINCQCLFSINRRHRQNLTKETSTKKRRLESLYALTRAVVYNAAMDSANPSSKSIRIGGVGYYAELEKKSTCENSCAGPEYILSLKLGYTHKVKLQVPKTLDIKIDKDSTTITISGIQRCFLGNFAAKVRAVSPIEPYHKKGLCYVNEVVRSKVAKSRKNKAKE